MTISDLMRLAAALALAATLGAGGGVAGDGGWLKARPGYDWSFPTDHYAHRSYRNEWWYFTGRLACAEEPDRAYGYQFTLFRIGLLPRRPSFDSGWTTAGLVMGHAAITDLKAGTHRFSETLYREIPMLAGLGDPSGPMIAWTRAPPGTDEDWTLRWNGRAFDLTMTDDARDLSFALRTRPLKPLVLQGPGGLSRKGQAEGEGSLYYSFTRLATEGRLSVDGHACDVNGVSWMDKEFGTSQLSSGQVGWDWFSIRLADGRDLMLYELRRRDGAVDTRSATLVAPDGTASWLADGEWSASPTGRWTSPATGAVYPSGWEVSIPGAGLALVLTPLAADQENRSGLARGVVYWEGAVTAKSPTGREIGEGYVELTGYGEGSRPPI